MFCVHNAFLSQQRTVVYVAAEPVSDPLKAFSALFHFLNVNKRKPNAYSIQTVFILRILRVTRYIA